MKDLLSTLTIDQIILYLVIFAIAIKELVGFISWCKEQYNQKFNKDYSKKKEAEKTAQHYQDALKHYQNLETKIDNINKKIDYVETKVDELSNSTEILSSSVMHDIKGWIVERHHELTKQGWVDDFSLDVLEKRYKDYCNLGGNSYIGNFMAEIRQLPHGIKQ